MNDSHIPEFNAYIKQHNKTFDYIPSWKSVQEFINNKFINVDDRIFLRTMRNEFLKYFYQAETPI